MYKRFIASVVIGFSCIVAFGALAAELVGKVVGVHDGDTLTLLYYGQPKKIRLAEIDAPELRQAFGVQSKASLSDLCFAKSARVIVLGVDRYKRTIGRVYCDLQDANAEQVRRGMSWVYDRYVTDRSLYKIQNEAKTSRRGLWNDSAAIPPWNWRRTKKMSPAIH